MRLDKLRVAVPLLGLSLLAIIAALFVLDRDLYHRVLATLGMVPFRYPFIDWEYVGAAATCWGRGVDVYVNNPCDVMDRLHSYSPLWLRASFVPTGPVWRNVIGLGMATSFFLSLLAVLRPVNWREAGVFAIAGTSTMVVFGLERGNVDVLLFLAIVAAAILGTGVTTSRAAGYAVLLGAGLLKYYPLVALLTALRERRRVFAGVALVAALAVAALFFGFRDEFAVLALNIPRGSFGSDLFGASNLPAGLATMAVQRRFAPELWFEPSSTPVRVASFVLLLAWCGTQALRVSRNAGLGEAFVRMAEREKLLLTLGAALIAGCFFTGQSIGYRGMYLLFVVAGLVALRREVEGADRSRLTILLLSVLFLMWNGAWRQALVTMGLPLHAALWLVNELLWWWLAATLIGILVIFASGSNAVVEMRQWFGGNMRRTSHNSERERHRDERHHLDRERSETHGGRGPHDATALRAE